MRNRRLGYAGMIVAVGCLILALSCGLIALDPGQHELVRGALRPRWTAEVLEQPDRSCQIFPRTPRIAVPSQPPASGQAYPCEVEGEGRRCAVIHRDGE